MTDPTRLLAALADEGAGRVSDAAAAYRAILEKTPDDGFALFLLGTLLTRTDRNAEAVPILRRAVTARPEHRESRLMLGNALRDTPDAAIDVFAALPDHPAAQTNLSAMLLATGQAEAALGAARRAIALAPRSEDAQIALAAAALALGDPAAALEAAEQGPHHPLAAFYRGTALSQLNRASAARSWLEAAVAERPDHFEALLNLGNVLTITAAFPAAEALLSRATTLHPARAEAWAGLGYLYEHWGRPAAQIAALDRAIALRPDDSVARYNRALARIASGDWARGFAEAECRRDAAVMLLEPPPPGPRYAGGDLRGKTILLCAEQGLGDTIQFLRYARPLRNDLGATVLARVPAPLRGIAAAMPEIAVVITPGAPLPAYETWIELLSLPHLLGTTPDTVPASGGYIGVPAAVAAASGGGVGLAWAGNPAHSNDFRRSLPAPALGALVRAVGSRAVSLQHGMRATEGEAYGLPAPELPDFAATARVIAELDLVIAVDTSVAHLAGAMGKRVWVLLNHMGEWRWGPLGQTTPWYDGMRLFRQGSPGDWAGVIERVGEALRAEDLAG